MKIKYFTRGCDQGLYENYIAEVFNSGVFPQQSFWKWEVFKYVIRWAFSWRGSIKGSLLFRTSRQDSCWNFCVNHSGKKNGAFFYNQNGRNNYELKSFYYIRNYYTYRKYPEIYGKIIWVLTFSMSFIQGEHLPRP